LPGLRDRPLGVVDELLVLVTGDDPPGLEGLDVIPDLNLAVAGDVICNGVHMYRGQAWSSEASRLGERRSTRELGADRTRSAAAGCFEQTPARSA
jgi:hypothetical protein